MTSTAHALIGSVLAGAQETAATALVAPAMLPPGCDHLWSLIRGAWAEGRQPTAEALHAAAPRQAALILDCLHASVNPAEGDFLASQLLEQHDREALRGHLLRMQQLLDGDTPAEEVAALCGAPPAVTKEPRAVRAGAAVRAWWEDDGDRGVGTPWCSYNDIVGVLRAGGLHIVGARPAVGKTLYALMVARGAACAGVPVRYVSLEMTARELAPRLVAQTGRIPLDAAALRRDAGERLRPLLDSAIRTVSGLPLTIADEASQTVEAIAAAARAAHHRGECEFLVIDHMQLIEASDRSRSLRETVTAQSRALKGLAMQLDIPVVVLSQLSRALEGEERPPRMSDLRESGSLEQDADTVTLLSMPVEGGEPDRRRLTVELAKNRAGKTGTTTLARIPEMARLEEMR
nr:MAG TPA: DnaB-like replicative helicase [Caudoviricetes sp.]